MEENLNDVADRLRNFGTFANTFRNRSKRDSESKTKENSAQPYARQTYYRSDASVQNTRLTVGQTLLAILMAVINFAVVYWQQYLDGPVISAIVVAGVSLIIGSTIPYAQCF